MSKCWSVVALVGLLGSGVAEAAPNNFGGGRAGDTQVYVMAGFAELEAGVFLPVGPLELKPRVRFGFDPLGPTGLSLTPEVGLDIRWQVFGTGNFTGAFVAGVDVPIAISPRGGVVAPGLGLVQPGLLMTYRLENVVDLDFGIIVEPILLFNANAVGMRMNIPLVMGVEYGVTDKIVLGFHAQAGPWIATGTAFGRGPGVGIGPYVRALFGVSFAL